MVWIVYCKGRTLEGEAVGVVDGDACVGVEGEGKGGVTMLVVALELEVEAADAGDRRGRCLPLGPTLESARKRDRRCIEYPSG